MSCGKREDARHKTISALSEIISAICDRNQRSTIHSTMTIGDKIRKVRELRGYKQEYVAGQLSLSVTAYGNIERNDSRLSVERLEQIAAVLQVSVPQLLSLAEAFPFSADRPGMAPADLPGYQAALRAQEQLVHSLLADIDHLRRQNQQLTLLLLHRKDHLESGAEERED